MNTLHLHKIMIAAVAVCALALLPSCASHANKAPPPPPPAAEKTPAGEGEMCGGIAGIMCGKGMTCDMAAGMCHTADAAGKCVKTVKPGDMCPTVMMPVCGCDGKTYNNDCERQRAGAQLDHTGKCAPSPKPSEKKK